MCIFREKSVSTYVRRMHWRGQRTRSWRPAVIRKCLRTAEMVVFSSSLTTVVKTNMSSPMPSAHRVDSPLSLAAMTGLHIHIHI